jgi:hypothetical protein
VKKPDRPGSAIRQPDRAAVGDVDSQQFARRGGDQTIHPGHHRQTIARRAQVRRRHQGDLASMDLLGPPPMVAAEILPHDPLVRGPQAGEGFIPVGRRLDTVHTTDPARPEAGQAIDRIQKRERLRHGHKP